jgi:hypothetical protein
MSIAHAINQFFADRNVQTAIEGSRETEPLQICYPNEISISRFIGWLLDPTEGHGLNGAGLRALLSACWRGAAEAGVNAVSRRRFAPALVATYAFSDIIIERELPLGNGSGQLDLLILLPRQRMVIAIENKFGARQGKKQLERYRLALAKRYPDWTQILVYLDIDGRGPEDDGWIGLDYTWLVDELRVAENSTWLGEQPRRAIRQFRSLLDPQTDAALPGIEHHRLRAIVRAHREVFEKMEQWENDTRRLSDMAAELFESGQNEEIKSLQLLFPMYCQRRHLWLQCISMMGHAGLQERAEQHYRDDLECDPKRTAFYFTLKPWHALQASANDYWPVQVGVRRKFDAQDATEKYAIISSFNFGNIEEELRPKIADIAEALRERHLKRRRQLDDEREMVTVRVSYAGDREEASNKLHQHLAELETAFRDLVRPRIG